MSVVYYVYAYIRKSDGRPFYIGKGKGKRAFNNHGRISVPKDKSKIVFLEKKLTEVGAFALERRYIRWYGRRGIDKGGILLNILEGGDSPPNQKGKKLSEEHIRKSINSRKGAKRSKDFCELISKMKSGKPNYKIRTKERAEKISCRRKGGKWYTNPNTNEHRYIHLEENVPDGFVLGFKNRKKPEPGLKRKRKNVRV